MKCLTLVLAGSVVFATVARAEDDPLTAAKNLYASAAFEEALAMLATLSESDALPTEAALQIDEYRSLCLYALGRTAEAKVAAQAVIRKDPLFQPSADAVSPRVEAMFTEARRQLLPGLIREKYRLAKLALDRKEFSVAEPHFIEIRRMIEKGAQIGLKDESLADLSVLTEGFLDLAHSLSAPKPSAPAVGVATVPARDTPTPDRSGRPGAGTMPSGAGQGATGGGATAQPIVSEEPAVREVLRQYEAAFSNLDAGAVKRVFPGVDEGQLRRSFADMSCSMLTSSVG